MEEVNQRTWTKGEYALALRMAARFLVERGVKGNDLRKLLGSKGWLEPPESLLVVVVENTPVQEDMFDAFQGK